MKKNYILLLTLLVFFVSCDKSHKKVEEILDKAGKNRRELEKVIEHYKALKDKEKLKAAYFLIGNMQNKYGRYGDFPKKYYPVFDKLHALNDRKIDKDTIDRIIKMEWDSIERVSGPVTNENYPAYADYYVINAEYLIENIDISFKAWKEKPWAKHLNFNQFCEYILPYRMYDEPLQFYRKKFYDEFAWLADSLKDKSNPLEACMKLNNYFAKNFIFCSKLDRCPILGVNDMYQLNAGICEHRYALIASIMRSVGIPVSLEITPQWNRYAGNHSWLSTIDKNGKSRTFNGGEPEISFPDSIYVPLGIKGRTTKIYRTTFALQKNALSFKLQPKDIPEYFKNPNIFDVTNEYDFLQTTVKFDLKISPPEGNKYTFLCAFGYSYQIVPVAYIKTSGSSVTFDHVGRDALYFPAYCSNNQFIIAGNPQTYPLDEPQRQLTPDLSKLVTVKLTRKYSEGGNMVDYAKCMVGAKLQGADNKEFKNPVTIFTIDTIYYYFVEKEIHTDKKFRFYRYLSSDTGKIRIAEVDFIPTGMENVIDKNKKFKIFGYAKKDSKSATPIFENAFDGNISTNFNAPAGSWVAIDYGKPVNISKVRFLLRNDQNVIEIGDEYELLYFDLGWHSIGKQKADHNYIIYNNVPDNALLLLRDLTKGKEERIFTYKKWKEEQWW